MKKSGGLLLILVLSGCVNSSGKLSSFSEFLTKDDVYTISPSSILSQVQEWKHQSQLKDDKELLAKGLKLKQGVNISDLKSVFSQYESLNKSIATDKKYKSCEVTVQKAKDSSEQVKSFYRSNREVIDIYESSQALGSLFTGFAVLNCAASEICRETSSIARERHGSKSIASGMSQIAAAGSAGILKNSLAEKGYNMSSAKSVMESYFKLKKNAQASYKKAESCMNYMINKDSKLDNVISQYAQQCVNNDWFGLKTEEGIMDGCEQFLSKGMYKKYL